MPSPNSPGMHWAKKARLIREARNLVGCLARLERTRMKLSKATSPATVHLVLVRGKGQRILDSDNAVGMCKVIRDSLIDAGWLVNDDPKHLLDYTVTQERGPNPAVRVEVTRWWQQRRDPTVGPAVEITISEVEE